MTVEAVNDLPETEIMHGRAGLTGEAGGLEMGCDDSRWLNLGIHSVGPKNSVTWAHVARLRTHSATFRGSAHSGAVWRWNSRVASEQSRTFTVDTTTSVYSEAVVDPQARIY